MRTHTWWSRAGTLSLAAAVAMMSMVVVRGADARRKTGRPAVKGTLSTTGVDPDAQGNFQENVEDGLPDGSGEMVGELQVGVAKLAARSTFTVKVAATPVATIKTNRSGSGRVRVRAKNLAADPRGQHLSVTDDSGTEVLETEVGDPTTPGATRCCLNTTDQQGCTDLVPADCVAAGGTDMGAGSCDPDPCPNTGPNDDNGSTSDGDNETNDDTGATGGAKATRR